MPCTPNILLRGFPHSYALESFISKKAEKVCRYFDAIMKINIVVDRVQKSKHQGQLYNVRVDVKVPGAELVANQAVHEDPYIASRDAFAAILKQIEAYRAK